MKVDELDYGAEDARNLRLKTESEKEIFLKSYVLPSKFKLKDFLDGYKYFVFGGKGAGKTALLQYIRIRAQEEINAEAAFFYFQSSFSKDELKAFLQHSAKDSGSVVDDTGLSDVDEAAVFWKLFLLLQVASLLKKISATEGAAEEFLKLSESAKLISQAKNVAKRYPSLEKFTLNISKDPKFELEGKFENATVKDLATYLNMAEDKLDQVYLDNRPIFIFIDEMEVYLKGDDTDALRLSAIASLIRAVRNFNERFYSSRIRVIAAVRDAVVDEVSLVQGEIYRVIRDNGVELDWPASVPSGFHPLERMILRRIIVQDSYYDTTKADPDEYLRSALSRYFEGQNTLRNSLNLTWYRPRDVALLFDEASALDRGKEKFSALTLASSVVKSLGKRLWQDAISGLAVKYKRTELDGIDRILRGGSELYTREKLFQRMDDLSHSYEDVAILSDNKWIDIIEDLYRVGAIYSVSINEGYKNFFFRGDPMPSLTEDFKIGVHQVLIKELSIRK